MLNDMRYRIHFQKKKPGGRLPVEGNDSWETVIECWAKAEGLKGREYYAAAAIQKEKQFNLQSGTGKISMNICESSFREKHTKLMLSCRTIRAAILLRSRQTW